MFYKSTRSHNERITGSSAILNGIAKDGGLYMPETFPEKLDCGALLKKSTYEIAETIFRTFFSEFSEAEMKDMVRRAYDGKFRSSDLTPLIKVGDRYVLELFHGPTSAFKDVALSALPVFMSEAKKKQGMKEDIIILTATSGDTGKAALEGFKDVPGIRIIVFYPYQGVSPIQELQMTTQEGGNVLTCAVRGNFDDTQTGVKEIFNRVNKEGMPENMNGVFSSANSINIGRLVPQIVYYFTAYRDLLSAGAVTFGDLVDYTVPTGNFGDILAGYFAKELGLPVGKLICASNENNILTDFIETGRYDKNRPFYKTSSPSMDILVSSNLERLLYLLSDRSEEAGSSWMNALSETGVYEIPEKVFNKLRENFEADFTDEVQTAETINEVFRETGYLLDPHTAVAYRVSKLYTERAAEKRVNVVLSTASPYKFPKAVLSSLGVYSESPAFRELFELSEKTGKEIPKNLSELQGKEVRFRDVVDKTEMYDYVMSQLKKG